MSAPIVCPICSQPCDECDGIHDSCDATMDAWWQRHLAEEWAREEEAARQLALPLDEVA